VSGAENLAECKFDGIVVSSTKLPYPSVLDRATFSNASASGQHMLYVQNSHNPVSYQGVAPKDVQLPCSQAGRKHHTGFAARHLRSEDLRLQKRTPQASAQNCVEDNVHDMLTVVKSNTQGASNVLSFASQGILTGLLFVSALCGLSNEAELDVQVMSHLEPGFNGVTLALVQVSLIGSSIRIYRILDSYEEEDGNQSSVLCWSCRALCQRKSLHFSCAVCSAFANVVMFLCCLLGTKSSVMIGSASLLASPEQGPYTEQGLLRAWHTIFGVIALGSTMIELKHLLNDGNTWSRDHSTAI